METETSKDVGEQLYAWAYARLGQQVGGGRSWELARDALRGIGFLEATGAADESTTAVWSVEIPVAEAMPGDILQLLNYAVVTTTVHTVRFADGTSTQRREQSTRTFAQHIAIVAAAPDERSVAVLDQGTRAESRVEQRVCLLRDVGPLLTRAFQSERDEAGQLRPAAVLQSTTLQVSGSIRVFRPTRARDARVGSVDQSCSAG